MLPEEFLARIKRQLGEEYPDFLTSLERPRAVALRINPLKGVSMPPDCVTDPVPWEKNRLPLSPRRGRQPDDPMPHRKNNPSGTRYILSFGENRCVVPVEPSSCNVNALSEQRPHPNQDASAV